MMEGPLNESRSASLLEENLKKALTEFLILTLLSEKENYIGALTSEIEKRSLDTIHIEFPYASISRIYKAGFIVESEKRIAPDGRLRQYYKITNKGIAYQKELYEIYLRLIGGVSNLLQGENCNESDDTEVP